MRKHNRALCTAALFCSALTSPSFSFGASTAVDPTATQKALSALFAAANDNIPSASSCHGNFGQVGRAKVRDMLAMQMAYLYAGTNVIQGHCSDARCTVKINHTAGEDVASAAISFSLNAGKARASSLQCIITP